MRIKFDENLPARRVGELRGRGLDVHTVADEDLVGTTDPDLLAHAAAEGRMIFTLDRGFGDVRRYPPGTHPGIVVFRLDGESSAAASIAVRQLVDHHDLDDLGGTVTVFSGSAGPTPDPAPKPGPLTRSPPKPS